MVSEDNPVPYYGEGEATTTKDAKEDPTNVRLDEINNKVIDATTTQNQHEPAKLNNENEEVLSSPEQIKERLDSLSKPRPFNLLRTYAILSRRMPPKYAITHSEIIENGETINVASVELHFIEDVIKIDNVKCSNIKIEHLGNFAQSIAADLLLKKLYPEDHDLDPNDIETKKNLHVEFSTDNEWYSAHSQEFKKQLLRRTAKRIKQVEKSSTYTDEEKTAKLMEVGLEKQPILEQLTYKELIKRNKFFANTYFNVLLNKTTKAYTHAQIQSEVNFDFKIHQIIDGEEIEIKNNANYFRGLKLDSNELVSCYKVAYTLKKNEIELFKIEQILTSSYNEAKNKIAYLVLEKLLLTGVIKTVTEDDLKLVFKTIENRKRKTQTEKHLPAKQKSKIELPMQNNLKDEKYLIFSQTFPVGSNF